MDVSNLPSDLKTLPQWVVWREEVGDKGKPTKVPYQSRSGYKASHSKPATWGTLGAALTAYSDGGGYNGISFAFSETDGLTGIDLDHCIDDEGRLEPWAGDIVTALNSYTEVSPSGRGLHIFVKGKLPDGGRKTGQIEMYDQTRFFTVTGNHWSGTPETIEDRQAELEALHARVFSKSETNTPAQPPRPAQPVNLDDNELIHKATNSKDGAAFSHLWRGDISGYPSQSEADLALCQKLAFWTGGDPARIDQLFRVSGLYREKWDARHYADGRTYGQGTIETALAGQTDFYSGNGAGPATSAASSAETPGDDQEAEAGPAERKRKPTTAEYIRALGVLGYTFRMNACNDVVEVNGQPISDAQRSKIRSQMRDAGYWRVNVIEDAWTASAYDNQYHPVKVYLEGLAWDGTDWINELAGHFRDTDDFLPVFLRRWLVGAVARVYEPHGAQSRMLILDGDQGLGKSFFVRWLAGPLGRPELYIEGPITPDDKDSLIRLITAWIWEVSELGSTTRRADREALKYFLSLQQVTVRKPYGHYDLVKPALSAFVGTVNSTGGVLDDPTGYRRFMAVHLESIDWSYTKMDASKVWAQAKTLYDAGEPWELRGEELEKAKCSCERFEVADPLDDLLERLYEFTGNSADFVTSESVRDLLHQHDWRLASPIAEARAIAGAMRKMGAEEGRAYVGSEYKRKRQRAFYKVVAA